MRHYISLIVTVLSALLLGYLIGKDSATKQCVNVTETRETTVDTTAQDTIVYPSELAM